ncbi:nuclear poly(A) polymerase 3 [Tanacetum coccineum]
MASHVTDHNNRSVVIVPNYTVVNPNFLNNQHVLVPVRYVVNPAVIAQLEVNRSVNLQQLIKDEGLVPSGEEERKRNDVIRKLKEIVFKWIKSVAYLRRLPQNNIRAASATILTYGSYGLGVYNAESDIDALCVGPWFATLTEDFFIGLHNMLANRVEVSDIHCVKDAKVPLMRFKFEGISVDLPYAQLQVTTVPEHPQTNNAIPMSTTSHFHEDSRQDFGEVSSTQDLFKFDWRNLFEPYPYSKNYQQFLKLCLSASNKDDLGDWIGWVKSRFPGILQKLEELHAFYDPNPTEYSDTTIQDPNIIFYWGIVPGLSNNLFDLNSVQREFKKYLGTGSRGVKGKISLSVIPASRLPKILQLLITPSGSFKGGKKG